MMIINVNRFRVIYIPTITSTVLTTEYTWHYKNKDIVKQNLLIDHRRIKIKGPIHLETNKRKIVQQHTVRIFIRFLPIMDRNHGPEGRIDYNHVSLPDNTILTNCQFCFSEDKEYMMVVEFIISIHIEALKNYLYLTKRSERRSISAM